ncbi:UDP-N-acetylglucosamine 2-epimerase [Campylobacter concisus]|uniref:GDP-2,4-diacetamido-2,4, 6-trideoxy-alpha-D-glucopyranose hydrolase / 2-epimerase n=1 Tax=Campylobacter concisus (strain 13826) TaxID=360104 RepID=A7ZFS3_CAMC1|nr:UDP-N-acetylglucosamine 2-epimerase [Campylobacter concisus]EAT97937.1 GDP-2,4-diacetamido-2,4,6-trideoxy-alpha-D-glucopyranose hydrolase / 2-epimerase [Campylobacter concisus 13826]
MRKICVVTSTRAEYGLLYWLLKEIEADSELKLQLIVTGMHLSPEFGLTYKEIEKEFKIDKKIEILSGSHTSLDICAEMARVYEKFASALAELKPDILVLLGDRYEIFGVAGVASIMQIPIAHIHGGETTQGAFDEAFRHSITKMSHIHFAATNEYANRIIQLGEDPSRVFNVGGPGIENIKKLNLLNKDEFEKSIKFKLAKKNILITFHPVTLENSSAREQFNELLNALDELEETNFIFTKANSDTDGDVINKMIDEYVSENPQKAVAFASLGQLRYLSAIKFVDIVLGNSSSGLLEVPSFKKATINIGDRQKGRARASSVIDVRPVKEEILAAIKRAYSKEFEQTLKDTINPYDGGNPSKKMVKILKEIKLDGILKKKFYDIGIK